jgi:hypothetical protein
MVALDSKDSKGGQFHATSSRDLGDRDCRINKEIMRDLPILGREQIVSVLVEEAGGRRRNLSMRDQCVLRPYDGIAAGG